MGAAQSIYDPIKQNLQTDGILCKNDQQQLYLCPSVLYDPLKENLRNDGILCDVKDDKLELCPSFTRCVVNDVFRKLLEIMLPVAIVVLVIVWIKN